MKNKTNSVDYDDQEINSLKTKIDTLKNSDLALDLFAEMETSKQLKVELEEVKRYLAKAMADVEKYKSGIEVDGVYDWCDHYSKSTITIRLNNKLPIQTGRVRVLIMKLEGEG